MIEPAPPSLSVEPPLVREIRPPPDPWEAFRRLEHLEGILFLDSALREAELGRYSFITALPFRALSLSPRRDRDPAGGDPFRELRQFLVDYRSPTVEGLPPFQGGAAGLFAYGLGRFLERIPAPRRDFFGLPDLTLGLYDWVLAFDRHEERAWLISQGFPEREPRARGRRARLRAESIRSLLDAPPPPRERFRPGTTPDPRIEAATSAVDGHAGLRSNFTRQRYLEVVERAIEYIHAGDIFQANLSQQLFHRQEVTPVELFRRLRERNPTTYAAYFRPPGADFTVVSASPERFLRLSSAGLVETRPIKGTRPRSPFAEGDRFSRDELRESDKDRSENVMIVDLLRNDLSRVCLPGSVEVPHLFGVETYPSIHHLVSVVRGRLRERRGALDLLEASFPGGSVTGAPKIRAMEIIAELEPDARGPYCGSLGYIGFDGVMDTSILIRTVTVVRGWLQFPVGGGIVARSSPEREYRETLDKASGILWALEDASESSRS